ncbi:MAG: hypothetical protein RJA72_111 [Pseudomonadota bacterium]
MKNRRRLVTALTALPIFASFSPKQALAQSPVTLLNVSYDPIHHSQRS